MACRWAAIGAVLAVAALPAMAGRVSTQMLVTATVVDRCSAAAGATPATASVQCAGASPFVVHTRAAVAPATQSAGVDRAAGPPAVSGAIDRPPEPARPFRVIELTVDF